MAAENKRNLDGIIKRCLRENKLLDVDLKDVDYEILLHNLEQNQFDLIASRLKEVDYASPHIIEQLYRYKEKSEEEQEAEESEVVKFYRSGKLDPATGIARFDKHKKRGNAQQSDTIISNLINQRNIKAGVEYLRFT